MISSAPRWRPRQGDPSDGGSGKCRRHAATDNLLSVGVPSAQLGAWVYGAAAACVLLCAVSVWSLGWIGLARLLADFGRTTNGQNVTQNNAAATALAATPKDPEVQSAQGLAFLAQRRNDDALRAFEQAVALRPRDYVMWLQLGRARDIARQEQQAIAPMQEAARWRCAFRARAGASLRSSLIPNRPRWRGMRCAATARRL